MATSDTTGLPSLVDKEENEDSDESEKDMYDFDDESARPSAAKRARSESETQSEGGGTRKPNESKDKERKDKRRLTNRKAAQKSRENEKKKEALLIKVSLDEESRRTSLRYKVKQLRILKEKMENILTMHLNNQNGKCVLNAVTSNTNEPSPPAILSPESTPSPSRTMVIPFANYNVDATGHNGNCVSNAATKTNYQPSNGHTVIQSANSTPSPTPTGVIPFANYNSETQLATTPQTDPATQQITMVPSRVNPLQPSDNVVSPDIAQRAQPQTTLTKQEHQFIPLSRFKELAAKVAQERATVLFSENAPLFPSTSEAPDSEMDTVAMHTSVTRQTSVTMETPFARQTSVAMQPSVAMRSSVARQTSVTMETPVARHMSATMPTMVTNETSPIVIDDGTEEPPTVSQHQMNNPQTTNVPTSLRDASLSAYASAPGSAYASASTSTYAPNETMTAIDPDTNQSYTIVATEVDPAVLEEHGIDVNRLATATMVPPGSELFNATRLQTQMSNPGHNQVLNPVHSTLLNPVPNQSLNQVLGTLRNSVPNQVHNALPNPVPNQVQIAGSNPISYPPSYPFDTYPHQELKSPDESKSIAVSALLQLNRNIVDNSQTMG